MNTQSHDFRSLPITERIQLVTEIWDSIADETPGTSLGFSAEDFAEWDRRLAAYRADPSRGIAWKEVEQGMFDNEERRETN